MALRQPAFAIAEIAYLRPRALYHRPRRRQSMTTGVNKPDFALGSVIILILR